jgi:hypothetical protein
MMYQELSGQAEDYGGLPFKGMGLPAIRRTVPLMEVSQAIPAFTRRPFRLSEGSPPETVNPFYQVIVRLPTEDESAEVPVGLVSRNYQLVQHHEILQRAASSLARFGIDLAKVSATQDLRSMVKE